MLAKSENAKDLGDITVVPLGFAVDVALELIRQREASIEPTIEWLIDEIAPNKGNSPLLKFNKERLLKLIRQCEAEAYERGIQDGHAAEFETQTRFKGSKSCQ